MLMMVHCRIVLLAVSLTTYLAIARPLESGQTLQLKDGKLKLALFCDMHFGENAAKDAKTVAFEKKLIELESPDLVVIDGDASSNYAAPPCNATNSYCKDWFMANWKMFTSPLEASHTPYAYTLGNHDRIPGPNPGNEPGNESTYAVPDHWIMNTDQSSPDSFSHDGPQSIHGASNYVLPVVNASGKAVAYVWLLDSSDNTCMGKTGWGCVYPDQVEWYRQTSKRLLAQDGKVLPGVMFHHIPTIQVMTAWNDPQVKVYGNQHESICCFSAETGLFAAIKEAGNIWGMFHGHDHNNDFVADYQGVRIGYGRKSGYGGYGGAVASYPGSRVIELQTASDGTVTWDTWIRLETGERITQTPAVGRTSQAACCGAVTLAETNSAEEVCRVKDDARACRAAVGLESSAAVITV